MNIIVNGKMVMQSIKRSDEFELEAFTVSAPFASIPNEAAENRVSDGSRSRRPFSVRNNPK